MSGIGYGTNTNAPIVEAGLHTIAGRKAPLPHNHSESPYPTTADSLDIHRSIYEHTLAFKDTDNKKKAVRGTTEVHTDLAGRFSDAESFEEIERRTKVIGVVRRDGIQNATSADDLTAVAVRGMISIRNTGGETLRAGDKIRAIVPVSSSGIHGFRNNPKDRSLIPTDALSSSSGIPRGKIHIQTVPVKSTDNVSVDAIASASASSSAAVKTLAAGLNLNDEALLSAAFIEAEEAGIIQFQANPQPNNSDRGSQAFLNRVQRIRRGIKESSGPFSIDGKSVLQVAQQAKWARDRRALHLRRRKWANDPVRQSVTNQQISQGPAILAHLAAGVRMQDNNVIGMALEDGRPGELLQASIDCTR